MSATNHTTTIGLSQYISTDKPTYLTDYNGDMLAIDNAFASDRDGIASAQNKANTADGKADANKTSIDTLDGQINGDPTATPPTTGIAGKVTTLENSVNSLSSLVGNGHPTTSDQTVIGAINNMENTIAPSEDGTELGADYDTGEKFMRGATLYEALVYLTSGTAFSALEVNTDYKVADRLVKQITDASSDITAITARLSGKYGFTEIHRVSVNRDETETISQQLDRLATAITSYFAGLSENVYAIPVAFGFGNGFEGACKISLAGLFHKDSTLTNTFISGIITLTNVSEQDSFEGRVGSQKRLAKCAIDTSGATFSDLLSTTPATNSYIDFMVFTQV